MSGGGGSKTPSSTTTTTNPWSGQQPYLKDIFKQAQSTYNDQTGQASYVSPLYQTLINANLAQGQGALPGGTSLTDAWMSQLGIPSGIQTQQDLLTAAGTATNPSIDTANTLTQQAMIGTGPAAALRLGEGRLRGLSADAQKNGSIADLNAIDTMNNPSIANLGILGAAAQNNPAMAQLMATANGDYLTPDSNPYLQQAVQNALDQAQSTIAGQFNQGGRYGSGMMAGTEAQQLGNIATNAYANAYNTERANQLAAQNSIGQLYSTGVDQGISAQNAAGQLYSTGVNQDIAAKQAAGQLYSTGIGQGISAEQAAGQLGTDQMNAALQAAGLSGQLSSEDLSRALQGQSGATQAYLAGLSTQANALNYAPTLLSMQNSQLGNIADAASLQQQISQLPLQQQWQLLNNYGGLVSGSYGQTATSTTPYYSNTAGGALTGALGGAASGATLGTAILPGWGTAIGGVLGGLAGGLSAAF